MSRRRSAAFTMVEMLAVIFLMGLVVSAVVNFYLDISRQSNAAADTTRLARRATAALDRIAHELEATLLVVRPGDVDPLDHPWVFFAENRGGGEGADRLRFVTGSHRPRSDALRESGVAVITYGLRESEFGGQELMRWSSPRLPERLDRDVPVDPDEGAQVLIDGVADFGLRFLAKTGEWSDAWDSSSLESNLLPVAAEIRLALEETDRTREPRSLERQVVLAMRPLDLETLLTPTEGGSGGPDPDGEEDETDRADCISVDECRSLHPDLDLSEVDPTVLESVGGQCASEMTAFFAIPEDCQ